MLGGMDLVPPPRIHSRSLAPEIRFKNYKISVEVFSPFVYYLVSRLDARVKIMYCRGTRPGSPPPGYILLLWQLQ